MEFAPVEFLSCRANTVVSFLVPLIVGYWFLISFNSSYESKSDLHNFEGTHLQRYSRSGHSRAGDKDFFKDIVFFIKHVF